MKTPDEIKKVLEHCIETGMGCHMCDYVVRCLKVVRGKPIMQDALALIQQLEAELATVKRERNAAIELLRGACALCKNDKPENEDDLCFRCKWGYGCTSGDFWEFSGIFPDTEASPDA